MLELFIFICYNKEKKFRTGVSCMAKIIADEIISRFLSEQNAVNIIYDEAYSGVAEDIAEKTTCKGLFRLSTVQSCINSFSACAESGLFTLVITENDTYTLLKVAKWLDFSHGEPTIPKLPSKVLVLPYDSAKRMFSGNRNADRLVTESELEWMKPDADYRLVTHAGTELTFTSRKWRRSDFEICTAPIENTVNGVIMVDAALFFRRTDDILRFEITRGRLTGITAETDAGRQLVNEYREMTREAFREPRNTQLAEIGLGCNTNAHISDCFSESKTVYKTCHFLFGDNLSHGGKNSADFRGASILINKPFFELI